MTNERLFRIGGYCGLVFGVTWIVFVIAYRWHVGFPNSPPSLLETAELRRLPSFRSLQWLLPVAFLAVVPFSVAAAEYLKPRAPASAKIGAAFFLLYAVLWMPFNAVNRAANVVVQAEPLRESDLSLLLTVVGNLSAPLFWAIALFQIAWAAALLKATGRELFAGRAFALGAVSTVTYYVMRYTAPYGVAEMVHNLLLACMVLGVGALGLAMLEASRESRPES